MNAIVNVHSITGEWSFVKRRECMLWGDECHGASITGDICRAKIDTWTGLFSSHTRRSSPSPGG